MKHIFLSILFNTPNILEEIVKYKYALQNYFLDEKEEIDLVHSFFVDAQDRHSVFYRLVGGIYMMGGCDAVAFVKKWRMSRGCKIEHQIAREYGLMMLVEKPNNPYYFNQIL